jgi:mono/diheme cytochrome c family protein
MPSMNTIAYGSLVLGGLTLFAIRHPKADAPPSPTTPGLVAPAAPPVPAATVLAAPAPVAAATSVSGNGFSLTSLSVELPSSDREFPPGPGVEAAQANCVACHSVGMVLNQPALSRATWETEVHKMIAVYKAPVSEEDAKTIVAYLDSIKGAK